MKNRAQVCKPGDFSIGQIQEFLVRFSKLGGIPELLQAGVESNEAMQQVLGVLKNECYRNEEVASNIGYPEGFHFRSAREQLDVILASSRFKKRFVHRELDTSHVEKLASGKLPDGAEGWAVIPKTCCITSQFDEQPYEFALEEALWWISDANNQFLNGIDDDFIPNERSWLEKKTSKFLCELERETPGSFLVIPFQFGLRHRGRSVRRTRICLNTDEFCFGPYETAVLMLTHLDRITGADQLFINCAGGNYKRSGCTMHFDGCLSFFWHKLDKRLVMADTSTCCEENVGSITGFYPPYLE